MTARQVATLFAMSAAFATAFAMIKRRIVIGEYLRMSALGTDNDALPKRKRPRPVKGRGFSNLKLSSSGQLASAVAFTRQNRRKRSPTQEGQRPQWGQELGPHCRLNEHCPTLPAGPV